jgi:NADPH:quinone reductase-like Zn-dependent oxidoreductase
VASLEDAPEPSVGARNALIDVRAAAVNPVELKSRAGKLKAVRIIFNFPVTLGYDVWALSRRSAPTSPSSSQETGSSPRSRNERMGAVAERVAADERVLARKPLSLDHRAAALPWCH